MEAGVSVGAGVAVEAGAEAQAVRRRTARIGRRVFMGRVLLSVFEGAAVGRCGGARRPPCKSTDKWASSLHVRAGHTRPLQWHYLICIVAYFLCRGKKKERDSISLSFVSVSPAGWRRSRSRRLPGTGLPRRWSLPSRRWRWHHAASPSSQQKPPCGRRLPHTPR